MYPLHQWTFPSQSPFDLTQPGLKTIKKEFNIEQILKNKRDKLEKMFDPLLRAYGDTNKWIYDRFEQFLQNHGIELD